MPPRFRTSSVQPATATSFPSSDAESWLRDVKPIRGGIPGPYKTPTHGTCCASLFSRTSNRNIHLGVGSESTMSENAGHLPFSVPGEWVRGFIVTWDVDSGNRTQCTRVRRFVFGDSTKHDGKTYRYPGFVATPGVVRLGQSVLFVAEGRLEEIRNVLRANEVRHGIVRAALGDLV